MNYRFMFTGRVNTEPKIETKEVGTKGSKKSTLSFQVATDTNKQYVQVEFWEDKEGKAPTQLTIQQLKEDGKRESKKIDFAHRREDVFVKNAPEFAKKEVYDTTFITYDKDVANEIMNVVKKGDAVYVTGQVKYEYSRKTGRVYQKFEIKSIKKAKEDAKEEFVVLAEVYFDQNALDKVQFDGEHFTEQAKADKIVPITTYVAQKNDFNDKEKVNFIPIPLVVNLSKFDFTNANHVKVIDRVETMLEDFVENFESVKVLKIKYEPVNGAETVEMTEEEFIASLPDRQKKHYEKGIMTKEEIKRTLGITKENVVELRFKGFTTDNNYMNGAIETPFTVDKLVEYISEEYTPSTTTSTTAPVKTESDKLMDEELDDLL